MTDISRATRRSTRLRDYDYGASGGYFLTICTDGRKMLFAAPSIKRIVEAAWHELPAHHAHIEIDELVVMPNHVHAILFLMASDGVDRAQQAAPLPRRTLGVPPGSLGAIVRSFKSRVTRDVRASIGREIAVWQRNYYEHVIRNEAALQRIRQYIIENPARWECDRENPSGLADLAEREFDEWIGSHGSITNK